MKKALLLLSLAISVTACKKNEPKSAPMQKMVSTEETVQLNCSIFDTMRHLDLVDQVKWLRQNQDTLCNSGYDNCREASHKISNVNYRNALADYWGKEPIVFTDYTIEQVKALSSQAKYAQFIRANVLDQNVNLAVTNDFSDTQVTFSVPLFYSIDRIHKLEPTDTLAFTLGKIDGVQKVLFTIKGSTDHYDVSTWPQ